VDYTEYEKRNRKGIGGLVFRLLNSGQIEYLKAIARWLINGDPIKSKYYLLRGHKPSIRKIAFGASVLLPNSDNEAERFFSFMKTRFAYRKVVNAINSNIFNESVVANALYENHILCVGRIEGRKNQLNLIKAVLQTPYHLTIIGKPSPNHISYYQECKFLASKSNKIQFIEHIEHEELVSIYRAAKVHVLPSWFETTGLSTLEAAVMECNIVITKKGDTEEYFRDYAYYCDPNDVMSIKSAIEIAYKSPINPELKNFILQNYTWEKTAEQTKKAYLEMVSSKR
jgi:glycosyltransferase involved in cell wall biosynthesis